MLQFTCILRIESNIETGIALTKIPQFQTDLKFNYHRQNLKIWSKTVDPGTAALGKHFKFKSFDKTFNDLLFGYRCAKQMHTFVYENLLF